MFLPALSHAAHGKGAALISAIVCAIGAPILLDAPLSGTEKLTWSAGLVILAGVFGKLFSKYFDARPRIIEAQAAASAQAAQTQEQQNAAFVQRMIDQQERTCAAYEKQIERLRGDIDYARARAEKAEADAAKEKQIAASASQSKHNVLTALQAAELWISNAQAEMKERNISEPYNYHPADWNVFFARHDQVAASLLETK